MMQDTVLNIPPLKLNTPQSLFHSKSYQDVILLATNLQEIVFKQQAIINALMSKYSQNEHKPVLPVTDATNQDTSMVIKEEYEPSTNSDQANIPTDNTSEVSEHMHTVEKHTEKPKPQIIRRNGFKPVDVTSHAKKHESDSDDESTDESGKILKGGRKNPSKAKHLWVNYGRRIIEYGINQTKGDMQEKIKQLIGKLNSKKDFEKIFQITESDSADDKLFKTLVGRLAIYFVKHKAATSFEGSKYKEEMITQRHVVAAWIERLICE
jgi:recombination DNA repair RAD52 pathway protein